MSQNETAGKDVLQAAIILSALAKAEWQKATGHLYAMLELHPHAAARLKDLVESFIAQAEERI